MKSHLANFLRPSVAVKPWHAIFLFILLQIYLASNALSFGFWKSADGVFGYMLVFYGVWLAGLVLLLSLILATGRRLNFSWFALAALVVLSIPFAWELWVRSMEFERDAIRVAVSVLLLPTMDLYFRIGLERVRWMAYAVLLLCALSFWGHSGLSVSTGSPQDFDTVELDKKTNVHVIMLDSFTHSPFSKEFMGVESSAADYLATLDDGFHAGALGFVENVLTRRSWRTLFYLGRKGRGRGFFSGRDPSPLTVLLRENGYTITTGFASDYFGWYKGEYVDHYHRGALRKLKHDLYCATRTGKLGFCSAFSQSIFSRFFTKKREDQYQSGEWPDTVVDLIDRTERNATAPQFSAFYIYKPFGHTPLDFRTDDAEMFAKYTQRFVDQGQDAREVIDKIDRLRRRYPESIFIVSGDHGPNLSRTAPDEERRFHVLDRHSVALALLNASNLCAWSRDWLARQRYLTPSRMLVASLACNGESRQLTEHFTDNEEFIRYGESFTTAAPVDDVEAPAVGND